MIKFVKFAITGIFNTAVDLATLNLLVALFSAGRNSELFFLYKTISFTVAVINSYFFNKYWVFRSGRQDVSHEFSLFVSISTVGLLCNVSVSSLVFHAVANWYGIPYALAVNIGALAGTGAVMVWNFNGYRFFVFKDKKI